MPSGVLFHETSVASFFGPVCNLTESVIPGNVLPVCRAGPTHLRLREAPRVEHILFKGRALRAQGSAVGRMIGIAFDVDHLRRDVLGAVADRVDENAATDRAVRAC